MIKAVDKIPELEARDSRLGEAAKTILEFSDSDMKFAEVTLSSYDSFDKSYHALVSASKRMQNNGCAVRVKRRSGRLYLERV